MGIPAKPTAAKPQWATSIDSLKVEPNAAKKNSGWETEVISGRTVGERPLMNYENWLKYSTYLWIEWAESAIEQLNETSGAVADNIEDLLAIEDPASVNKVIVLGYHTAGDGGGGVYVWSDNVLAQRHNGGTEIWKNAVFPTNWDDPIQREAWQSTKAPDNDGGGWRRLSTESTATNLIRPGQGVNSTKGSVNPRWFGAKGDGVTNDYWSFRQCISYYSSIELTMGRYVIDETLELRQFGLTIYSNVDNKEPGSLPVLLLGDNCTTMFRGRISYGAIYFSFKGLQFEAKTPDANGFKIGTTCLDVQGAIKIENCVFSDFEHVVDYFDYTAPDTGSYYTRVNNCRFSNIKIGFLHQAPYNFHISNCRCQYIQNLVSFTSGGGPAFFSNIAYEVFSGPMAIFEIPSNSTNVVFDGCYFEDYYGLPWKSNYTSSSTAVQVNNWGSHHFEGSVGSLTVKNNWIYDKNCDYFYRILSGTKQVDIQNNSYYPPTDINFYTKFIVYTTPVLCESIIIKNNIKMPMATGQTERNDFVFESISGLADNLINHEYENYVDRKFVSGLNVLSKIESSKAGAVSIYSNKTDMTGTNGIYLYNNNATPALMGFLAYNAGNGNLTLDNRAGGNLLLTTNKNIILNTTDDGTGLFKVTMGVYNPLEINYKSQLSLSSHTDTDASLENNVIFKKANGTELAAVGCIGNTDLRMASSTGGIVNKIVNTAKNYTISIGSKDTFVINVAGETTITSNSTGNAAVPRLIFRDSADSFMGFAGYNSNIDSVFRITNSIGNLVFQSSKMEFINTSTSDMEWYINSALRATLANTGSLALRSNVTGTTGTNGVYFSSSNNTLMGFLAYNAGNGDLTLDNRTGGKIILANGDVQVNTFTQLGGSDAPNIKMKKIIGTTAATIDTIVSVPHGLVGDKIIGLQGIVRNSTNTGYAHDDNYFVITYDATDVNVFIRDTSILANKPFSILITYEA